METLLSVLKTLLLIVFAIPVIGYFFCQSVEIQRRTEAQLVNSPDGANLVLHFHSGDFGNSPIKIHRIYSFALSSIVVSPAFEVDDSEATITLPCRVKSSKNQRIFCIALLTQKSSYWSLTMIKTKAISATT